MISIEIYDSFEATVKLWYIWTWVSSVIARAAGRNWHLFAGKVSSLYRPDTLLLIEYFSIDIKDSQLPLSVISPFRFMIVPKPQTNDDLLNVKPSHRIKATRPTHIQRGCQLDFLLHSCLCVHVVIDPAHAPTLSTAALLNLNAIMQTVGMCPPQSWVYRESLKKPSQVLWMLLPV